MKKSDITKQKILHSAEIAFVEKGLYGARVDEISESAGVNKRMIYAHFGSKENLYVAVLDTKYLKESIGKQAKTKIFDSLRTIIRKGIKDGVFRDDLDEDELILSTQMMSYSYFSNIHTMAYLMDKDFFSDTEMKKRCHHITDMVLEYILK